jgi:glycosyltransferase involved in cell wall biosynthesis
MSTVRTQHLAPDTTMPLGMASAPSDRPAEESQPFVSVILPVRNEGKFIARSLGAVFLQDYPADKTEVIVSDGMSTDETREFVQMFAARHSNLILIDNPGRIVPCGLNAAIARARGSVIARVDGHCEIAPDYIRRCVQHLSSGDADCVGGPLETIGDSYVGQCIAAGMSSPFGVGNSAFRTVSDRTMLTDTVAFPAFTRAMLRRTGKYDEEFRCNEDDEYTYRARKLGARIMLAADIKSRYYSRSSLRSLWRQYFRYGCWKVRVLQRHPRQMRARQFIPSAFVAALLVALSLALFSSLGVWLLALVMGSYSLACIAAAVVVARKFGWRLLPLLPVVFASLHLSFGSGLLYGLFRFAHRWRDHGGDQAVTQTQFWANTDPSCR